MTREWFDHAGDGTPGLRFECTQCGNCCSGPPGYVTFTDDEARGMAAALSIEPGEFIASYTEPTSKGRSLREVKNDRGWDCVFLDRQSVPGKAICGIYDARPAQCRTWPFWNMNLTGRKSWERSTSMCPGMDTGRLYSPDEIRIIRDRSPH